MSEHTREKRESPVRLLLHASREKKVENVANMLPCFVPALLSGRVVASWTLNITI